MLTSEVILVWRMMPVRRRIWEVIDEEREKKRRHCSQNRWKVQE